MAYNPTCSCGCTESHEIARRRTTDGLFVVLWSDAMVTGILGYKLQDIPMVRPKTEASFNRDMAAGRKFMDWVSIHPKDEIAALYAKFRKEASCN